MIMYLILNTIFLVFFLGIGIFSFVTTPIALLLLMLVNIFYAIRFALSDIIVSHDWVYAPSCLGQLAYVAVYIVQAYLCYKLAFASFQIPLIPLVFYGIVLIKASGLASDWIYHELENYRMAASLHKKTVKYRKLLKVSGILFIVYAILSLFDYEDLYALTSAIDTRFGLELSSKIAALSNLNFGTAHKMLAIIPIGFLAAAAVLYVIRTIHIFNRNKKTH